MAPLQPRAVGVMSSLAAVLAGCHQLHACVGRTVVIKYGGAAMGKPELQAAFAADIVRLWHAGVRPVVVHGDGPQIDALMRRVGKSPRFVDGLRVTDAETMELVEMVLAGKINAEIVSLLNRHGGRAVGLSGKDAETPLAVLEDHGLIPVVAPIATGRGGDTYNVNADYVAAALAVAVHAVLLLLVTDVLGIRDTSGRLVRHLDAAGVERLVGAGAVDGRMRPKTGAALRAVAGGSTG